jgi:hypothetical protein
VHEYIFPVLAADEPVTLGVVKPLYCSCFHGGALFPLVFEIALKLAGMLQAGHARERRNCEVHRTAKFKRDCIIAITIRNSYDF